MSEYMAPIEHFLQTNCIDGCLSSVFEIENAMLHLQKINDDIEHLKGLKKHRAQAIDTQISSLSDDTLKLRDIILQTMKKLSPDKKTLSFPEVGKVSRRVSKDGWEIENSESLLDFFDSEGKKSEVIKIKEVLDIKNAKKMVEVYMTAGITVPPFF